MAAAAEQFSALGVPAKIAERLCDAIGSGGDALDVWRRLCQLLSSGLPFEVHQAAHAAVFANWDASKGPAPVWVPGDAAVAQTNLAKLMMDVGVSNYPDLHRWSVENRTAFWEDMVRRLGIHFHVVPDAIRSDDGTDEEPKWLAGAQLNIADSCFGGEPDRDAVVSAADDGTMKRMSLGELDRLTSRVANGLREQAFERGDAIAIDMPMTAEAVAIYLGIIRAGCVAVSIADSFAPEEIATRLRIAGAQAAFTQDVLPRSGKTLPLFEKVVQAGAGRIVVLPAADELQVSLRDGDLAWSDFLSDSTTFDSVPAAPDDTTNVLFSSGTTGDPKAIPWTHTTPIKCAADGWLHHDIREGDVVAWPTNLGWMMGPWLIYASLINGASMALYEGAPNTPGFCRFVQEAGVTMLGVVPSLVKAWRAKDMTDNIDWTAIRTFSSTGECSNAEDMFWLMSRAAYSPVIEYCGGTEIGGGYITGTMIQPAVPAAFTTAAMGLDFVILDEAGAPAESGELFLVPPSIGLSTRLLNRDHHEVYFADVPVGSDGRPLRRHCDEMRAVGGGYFRALGRADDTMNLGGIKVSSAEIERVVNSVSGVTESAAIAVPPPGGGPDQLVICYVPSDDSLPEAVRSEMQGAIRSRLNPLFRVHAALPIEQLPRTASNKVMRRTLRSMYHPG